ncbi:argonaute AGO, partial [Cardiosporidium cionae]
DSYWGNVSLKVNVKLNGRNATLHADSTNPCYKVFRQFVGCDNSTLVMGGDVTYFGNKRISPSLACLVGSLDDNCNHYDAFCNPQPPKQEIILEFDGAIKQFLNSRKKLGIQKPPNRVIYLRDGVSESQMTAIVTEEVPYLRAALAKHCKTRLPKLLVILVVKREGKRFFAKDVDASPPAGFCVLKDLQDPGPFKNFFLQPHSGRIGCLIAPRYFVLVDEIGISTLEAALLMNAFCFLWSRATGAISIPAPVKCADQFASRMRGTLKEAILHEKKVDLDAAEKESSDDLVPSLLETARRCVASWRVLPPMFYM